ncbi:hypothetical protein HHI36_005079 [Cryptolaemus montrouzieri]|uniref:Uncharacterized protein n=1 Tax=Cryptolaemus montrouzieri TaxID=559131 RepID=A0ABD2NTL7_9CUCU
MPNQEEDISIQVVRSNREIDLENKLLEKEEKVEILEEKIETRKQSLQDQEKYLAQKSLKAETKIAEMYNRLYMRLKEDSTEKIEIFQTVKSVKNSEISSDEINISVENNHIENIGDKTSH